MKLSDFDYNLPKELIAQHPLKERDASRMMVLDRKRQTIKHKHFSDIEAYLKKEDVVILNNSKVLPARIRCKKETGGKAEIFLLKKIKKNIYQALVRPAARLFPGKRLLREDGSLLAEVVENKDVGRIVRFADVVNIERDLEKIGEMPLPPYIKRDPIDADKDRYQTVYGEKEGSTASPTAGLHFTKDKLQRLSRKGLKTAFVTLHVSYGTFAPIKVDDVEKHVMHRERYELPRVTQEVISNVKNGADGGRILSVGTTTTRVLEANADTMLKGANKKDQSKKTDVKSSTGLFIYPPYRFQIVDMLFTNFHLPKSTLLLLVSAFAGRDFILKAYEEAIKKRYRFYSYGDCMLIL